MQFQQVQEWGELSHWLQHVNASCEFTNEQVLKWNFNKNQNTRKSSGQQKRAHESGLFGGLDSGPPRPKPHESGFPVSLKQGSTVWTNQRVPPHLLQKLFRCTCCASIKFYVFPEIPFIAYITIHSPFSTFLILSQHKYTTWPPQIIKEIIINIITWLSNQWAYSLRF